MTGTKTLICFDYGKKRIGIAVGQTLTRTASPLGTVRVYRGVPDWEDIGRYIEDWQPDELVVGKPLNMDGSGQAMTREANRFALELSSRFSRPVHRADERLSSYEAKQRLKNTYDIDPVAAQAILETWLAENTVHAGENDTLGRRNKPKN